MSHCMHGDHTLWRDRGHLNRLSHLYLKPTSHPVKVAEGCRCRQCDISKSGWSLSSILQLGGSEDKRRPVNAAPVEPNQCTTPWICQMSTYCGIITERVWILGYWLQRIWVKNVSRGLPSCTPWSLSSSYLSSSLICLSDLEGVTEIDGLVHDCFPLIHIYIYNSLHCAFLL